MKVEVVNYILFLKMIMLQFPLKIDFKKVNALSNVDLDIIIQELLRWQTCFSCAEFGSFCPLEEQFSHSACSVTESSCIRS